MDRMADDHMTLLLQDTAVIAALAGVAAAYTWLTHHDLTGRK
jgi:hypothetical protein